METLTDVEFFNVSDIKPGWVIFLHKPPPSGEYLECKWANSYCKNNCHLKEKGYWHPIAVVGVRNLEDERVQISFVQMTTTPFGGDRATVYSSPGEFEFKDKSRKYFFEATWHEGFKSHFHVPHVYTITVELLSKRFGPFPSNIDHLKGQFPVTGRFFRLEDRFLKMLMKEVHLLVLELRELASQRRQSQTGRNHSPYNDLFTSPSSPNLHSSSDDNSPTSSATTSIRASDNQTSETSQAQNSATLETDEHREIEESYSHQPTKSEIPASEQPDTVAEPDLQMTLGKLRVASFRPIKLPWMSPSKDSGPGA